MSSPLAVLYYEEYVDLSTVAHELADLSDQIQCVVANKKVDIPIQQVGFGESQQPRLWDYADGVNTIEFLLTL